MFFSHNKTSSATKTIRYSSTALELVLKGHFGCRIQAVGWSLSLNWQMTMHMYHCNPDHQYLFCQTWSSICLDRTRILCSTLALSAISYNASSVQSPLVSEKGRRARAAERESRKGAQLAAGPLALGPARARMGGRGRLSLQSELGCGVSFWETEGPAGLLLRSGQKEKERKRV